MWTGRMVTMNRGWQQRYDTVRLERLNRLVRETGRTMVMVEARWTHEDDIAVLSQINSERETRGLRRFVGPAAGAVPLPEPGAVPEAPQQVGLDQLQTPAQAARPRFALNPTTLGWGAAEGPLGRDEGFADDVELDDDDRPVARVPKGVEVLDIAKLEELPTSRLKMPVFNLTYDTVEELRMRFHNTCIMVKGHPFRVVREDLYRDGFHLGLEDAKGKNYDALLTKEFDFRSPPSGYLNLERQVGYFQRLPERVNTQGVTTQNAQILKAGTAGGMSWNVQHLVRSLASRKDQAWDGTIQKLVEDRILLDFRLSDMVAVYTKTNSDSVFVEYKGRRMGILEGNVVKLDDEDDADQPWVTRDLRQVNLEHRV